MDEIEVYKTVGGTGTSFVALNPALKNGEIDALAFFSPTAVQHFTHAVDPETVRKPFVACIGSSTAEAAASAGFVRIITASEATAESLFGALARYFDR